MHICVCTGQLAPLMILQVRHHTLQTLQGRHQTLQTLTMAIQIKMACVSPLAFLPTCQACSLITSGVAQRSCICMRQSPAEPPAAYPRIPLYRGCYTTAAHMSMRARKKGLLLPGRWGQLPSKEVLLHAFCGSVATRQADCICS